MPQINHGGLPDDVLGGNASFRRACMLGGNLGMVRILLENRADVNTRMNIDTSTRTTKEENTGKNFTKLGMCKDVLDNGGFTPLLRNHMDTDKGHLDVTKNIPATRNHENSSSHQRNLREFAATQTEQLQKLQATLSAQEEASRGMEEKFSRQMEDLQELCKQQATQIEEQSQQLEEQSQQLEEQSQQLKDQSKQLKDLLTQNQAEIRGRQEAEQSIQDLKESIVRMVKMIAQQNEEIASSRNMFTSRLEELQTKIDAKSAPASAATIFSESHGDGYHTALFDELIDAHGMRKFPIHRAVYFGYLKKIEEAVNENKAELNELDGKGRTPLDLAALTGQLDVVNFLLDQGGVFRRDEATMIAYAQGRAPLVDSYLSYVRSNLSEFCDQLSTECTPTAKEEGKSSSGSSMTVQLELMFDEAIEMEGLHKLPIHRAVYFGHMEQIKQAIEMNENRINQLDCQGRTPLDLAALTGQVDVVELLRQEGCRFQYRGKTFMLAYAKGRAAFAHVYLHYVRSKLSKLCKHQSPDSTKRAHEERKVMMQLYDVFDELIEVEGMQKLPLHRAVYFGDLEEIEKATMLSESDLNQLDGFGRTPLDLAALTGQENVIEFLRQLGGKFEERGKNFMIGLAKARAAFSDAYLDYMRSKGRH